MVLRCVEEVWNQHDLDAIDELVSPDYLNHATSTDVDAGEWGTGRGTTGPRASGGRRCTLP
jgi:hypothetical protein